MKYLLIIFLASFTLTASSQSSSVKQLLRLAQNDTEIFVSQKPYSHIVLDIADTADYIYWIKEDSVEVKTQVFIEIIKNSTQIDTTDWTDDELDSFILIPNNADSIDLKYVISKLSIKSDISKINYEALVTTFNNSTSRNKVFKISRPIFDNTGTYAIIAISGGRQLGGGGEIRLLHYSNKRWGIISVISFWHT